MCKLGRITHKLNEARSHIMPFCGCFYLIIHFWAISTLILEKLSLKCVFEMMPNRRSTDTNEYEITKKQRQISKTNTIFDIIFIYNISNVQYSIRFWNNKNIFLIFQNKKNYFYQFTVDRRSADHTVPSTTTRVASKCLHFLH